MTLKEKLSLSRIEHFSLVLEQQHSISKLLLLHDEERIQQVHAHTSESFLHMSLVPDVNNKVCLCVCLFRWCRRKRPTTTDVCSVFVLCPKTYI